MFHEIFSPRMNCLYNIIRKIKEHVFLPPGKVTAILFANAASTD